MSLIDLLNSQTSGLSEKKLSQVISFAGDGKLIDGNSTSLEFRDFLKLVPNKLLYSYSEQCLTETFESSAVSSNRLSCF